MPRRSKAIRFQRILSEGFAFASQFQPRLYEPQVGTLTDLRLVEPRLRLARGREAYKHDPHDIICTFHPTVQNPVLCMMPDLRGTALARHQVLVAPVHAVSPALIKKLRAARTTGRDASGRG
jgi:hypothetical protein